MSEQFAATKRTIVNIFMFLLILTLVGCQAIPTSLLSPKQENGTGRLVIRPYYMPLGANLIAIFMAGGTTAFNVNLYDVTTDQPKYLGNIKSDGVRVPRVQDVIEYDVQAGTKILMLHTKTLWGKKDRVDFIEIPLASNQTQHVSISQYGMSDYPYLMENVFDQRASNYCGYTKGIKFNEASDYFKTEGIPVAKHTIGYCVALSSSSLVKQIPPDTEWSAPISSEHVMELKNQYLELWRKMPDRTPPYDIN